MKQAIFLNFDIFIETRIMTQIELEQRAKAKIAAISGFQSQEQERPPSGSFLFYVEKCLETMNFPMSRTIQCKHQGSCISSIISTSLKSGTYGYVIKLGLSTVFKIRSLMKNPQKFRNILTSKDPLKFSLFAFTFVFVFRTIVCFLRRKISSEKKKYIFFIAGLISGTLAIFNLQKKTRQSLALFLFARALDSAYHTLVQKGYLPQFKYYYVLVYSLMMFVNIGIAFFSEPGVLTPELNKFYNKWATQTLNEQQMRRIWIQRKNNEMTLKGIEPYFPLSYMPALRKVLAEKYLQ